MTSLDQANAFIRMTLREWNVQYLPINWEMKHKKTLGAFSGDGPNQIWIDLNPRILQSDFLFRWVFLHELAHFLDFRERGWNSWRASRVKHNKNFRKWCKILQIPTTTYISPYEKEKACAELAGDAKPHPPSHSAPCPSLSR
jgi:predicted SprT family Zn-dependent metalloprotease